LAAGKADLADEGLLLDGGISEKGANGWQEEVIGWRLPFQVESERGVKAAEPAGGKLGFAVRFEASGVDFAKDPWPDARFLFHGRCGLVKTII